MNIRENKLRSLSVIVSSALIFGLSINNVMATEIKNEVINENNDVSISEEDVLISEENNVVSEDEVTLEDEIVDEVISEDIIDEPEAVYENFNAPEVMSARNTSPNASDIEKKTEAALNTVRNSLGLPNLWVDCKVSAYAQSYANWLSSTGNQLHINDGWGGGNTRYLGNELVKLGWNSGGDLLGFGQTNPQQVVNAWLNSPGHRRWIVDSYFDGKAFGIGYKNGVWVLIIVAEQLKEDSYYNNNCGPVTPPPAPNVDPNIIGNKTPGSILKAEHKIFDANFSYKWVVDNKTVSTNNEYIIKSSDRKKNIYLHVTAVNNSTFGSITEKISIVVPNYKVERTGGKDRYETSYLLAKKYMLQDMPVFIASGAGYADALSAGPAASKVKGTLVLTQKNNISNELLNLIKSKNPSQIYIIGGESMISRNVENVLKGISKVDRIAGKDRYDTSLQILNKFYKDSGSNTAYIATGKNFPDALAAGAVAGTWNSPILLVDGKKNIDTSVIQTLKNFGFNKAHLVGGTSSLSFSIEKNLQNNGFGIKRASGKDRYETANLINAAFAKRDQVWISTGNNYPDALAAGAIAGRLQQPLYLSNANCVPKATVNKIEGNYANTLQLIGSTGSLSNNVANFNSCK